MTDARTETRIPLKTLAIAIAIAIAIALGLVGLADAWTIATRALALPAAISEALWLVAAAAWLRLLVAHARRGRRAVGTLGAQLRHPLQGPVTALAPIVGIVLGAERLEMRSLAGQIDATVERCADR
ncbi:hypothetical protein [Amnibacterium sp.]|uniref:hypothetical protein n=1 Tax=Amnibacterium sp. TaxID=1872496 RepID=UPI002634E5A1|nr:hypothetical protein [Amnibacterium sp.]MCU1472022.1 putative transporter [Amnibacterium sp.]